MSDNTAGPAEAGQRRSFLGYLKMAVDPPAGASNRDLRLAGAALCALSVPLIMLSCGLALYFGSHEEEEHGASIFALVAPGLMLVTWSVLVTGIYRILWPASSSFLTRIPKALVACGISFPVTALLMMPAMIIAVAVAAHSRPTVSLYDRKADAKHDIAQALVKAGAESKRVLVDFGADWCPDCVALTHLMDSAEVKPFVQQHFVVVRVDVEKWDANLDLSEKYGDPIKKGIPAVVVLSPHDEVVASTKDGGLADARHTSRQQLLALLKAWAPYP